ncbi:MULTISPECIES: hypothetical protein [Bacillus]|uniref:hypothetical protein n=1 Tax=Bacillus TaxID=1386 RepID=UPI0015C450E2|nr:MULTISPECIES: hypothetical protein [Bacillus]
MKTVIEIEAKQGEQIKHRNISRIMYGINDRYGNDITVKFKTDGTHTVEQNKKK